MGNLYTLRIRGAPDTDRIQTADGRKVSSSCFEVHKKHLHFLRRSDTWTESENHRKELFELCTGLVSPISIESMREYGECEDKEVRNQVNGLLLGDDFSYLLWKHTNHSTLDGLPCEVEEKVMTLLVEQYYTLGGYLVNSGRMLTSYQKALQPFVIVEEQVGTGKALTKVGTPRTGEKIVSWFESLVLHKSSKSTSLFFRALAFAIFRLDHVPSDDSFLDAFYVLFCAIQMMTGKGSSIEMRLCQTHIQESIDSMFQKYGSHFQGTEEGTRHKMTHQNLLWCLCHSFLQVSLIVRDRVPENQYDILLPNPYGDTINEQIQIANICMECRNDHPSSYYASFKMLMDVKDVISPPTLSNRNNFLSKAFKVVRLGKEVAFHSSNSYYSFVFLLIETFFIPTSLWPRNEVVTYKCLEERLEEAEAFKNQCHKYTRHKSIDYASHYKKMLMAFLKSVARSSSISLTPDMVVSLQFDPYLYCTARFANTSYYKPGGEFDRLATKYVCSYCSKHVGTLLRCSRCRKENYCSRECQKKHWKSGHREVCNIHTSK